MISVFVWNVARFLQRNPIVLNWSLTVQLVRALEEDQLQWMKNLRLNLLACLFAHDSLFEYDVIDGWMFSVIKTIAGNICEFNTVNIYPYFFDNSNLMKSSKIQNRKQMHIENLNTCNKNFNFFYVASILFLQRHLSVEYYKNYDVKMNNW